MAFGRENIVFDEKFTYAGQSAHGPGNPLLGYRQIQRDIPIHAKVELIPFRVYRSVHELSNHAEHSSNLIEMPLRI